MTDDAHPEALLAEYVEGTLDPPLRGEVERHLDACDRCGEEVALAREAREALTSLPVLQAPEGVPLAVRRAEREVRTQRSFSWLGRAAAVLLIVGGLGAGLAYVLDREPAVQQSAEGGEQPAEASDTGGGDEAQQAPAAEAAEAESAPRAAQKPVIPTYRETARDFGPSDLPGFARGLRDDVRRALEAGVPPTAGAFLRNFDPAAFTPPVRTAIRCVLAEVPPDQFVVPFSIEAATFQGEPAYLGAFLQGPTPDQPYDRIVIWVVSREGCALRSLATQRL